MMPNFLIIGAAKGGTTSIYEYLKQHPQVFMSKVKEPSFYPLEGQKLILGGPGIMPTRPWVTNLAEYEALFDDVTTETAVGEASVMYLYHPKTPAGIYRHAPDMKLIAILRNPVERAYSSFYFMHERGREPFSNFADALEDEPRRIRENWDPIFYYKQMGFYGQQLQRYFELFDRSQIKIYLYEEFDRDNRGIMREVYSFLGVDPGFVPDTSMRYHQSGVAQGKMAQALFARSNRMPPYLTNVVNSLPSPLRRFYTQYKSKSLVKPALPADTRKKLVDEYSDDILQLQSLLKLDLSRWLQVQPAATSATM
jgi:hypothetical protein